MKLSIHDNAFETVICEINGSHFAQGEMSYRLAWYPKHYITPEAKYNDSHTQAAQDKYWKTPLHSNLDVLYTYMNIVLNDTFSSFEAHKSGSIKKTRPISHMIYTLSWIILCK